MATEGLIKDNPSDSPLPDGAIQTVRGFREDFVELLQETQVKTLVVFIDELDRCLPNAVVETLEAIRLFLFVEKTVFVIGADEELVRHAVNQRFQHEGLQTTEGGRYLEKMIQVPFRIPPMGPREMQTYMNLLFARLYTQEEEFEKLVEALSREAKGDFGEITFDYTQAVDLLDDCPAELSESFVLTEQIGGVLTHGLKGNPRQLKRFLNMLLLRLRLAEHRGLELELRPFGKLMLLEYFHPERFKQLAAWQRADETGLTQLNDLERAARERWRASEGSEEESKSEVEGGDDDEGNGEKTEEATTLPDELGAWLEDVALLRWLQADPQLTETDLRPYFYITRAQTPGLGTSFADLSPAAAEVLRKLRSDSEALRTQAERAAGDLALADAAAILKHLAEDIRQADELATSSDPPLASLLSLMEARPDLRAELSPLLHGIPAQRLPVGVVPVVESLLKDGHVADLKSTLGRWVAAKGVAPRLASAAEQALSRRDSEA